MGKEVQVVNFDEMAMSTESVKKQVDMIQEIMKNVMKEGEHYGTIPGCGDKKALKKSGAEKLCNTFRFAPSFEIREKDFPGGHREYEIVTQLIHIPTDLFVGQGVGICSTMESKYRWRKAERACPVCGAYAIIKGSAQYGGGWLCWKKKDGCGAKFSAGDPQIESQQVGRVENSDIADTYNTVLKMGKKRSLVDAILTATAASDIFMQDVEDGLPLGMDGSPPPPTQQPPQYRQSSQGMPPQPPPHPRPQSNQQPTNNPPAQGQQPKNDVSGMRAAVDPALMRDAVLGPWKAESEMFAQFLIQKAWIKEGQSLSDLNEGQIKRLANNQETMMQIYNTWKNSQY